MVAKGFDAVLHDGIENIGHLGYIDLYPVYLVCQFDPQVGHHIKSLKNLTDKYGKTKHRPWHIDIMMSRRRKSIFLCKMHHQMVTDGKYDGMSLKEMANWRAG